MQKSRFITADRTQSFSLEHVTHVLREGDACFVHISTPNDRTIFGLDGEDADHFWRLWAYSSESYRVPSSDLPMEEHRYPPAPAH